MLNLNDLDPSHLQKIIEVHQQKEFLSFTDSLRICASLKIFPDLLSSQEIRKIFMSLATPATEKMTYAQLEIFLKTISKLTFRHCKKQSDECSRLICYIKAATSKQFNPSMQIPTSRSSLKPTERSSNLSVSTPRTTLRNSLFQSSEKSLIQPLRKKLSSKVLNKTPGLLNLLSPVMKNCRKSATGKFSVLTERRNGQSFRSISPVVEKVVMSKAAELLEGLRDSMARVPKAKFRVRDKLKEVLQEFCGTGPGATVKLAFTLWRLSVNYC